MTIRLAACIPGVLLTAILVSVCLRLHQSRYADLSPGLTVVSPLR